jgi:type VI secretion system protein ImpF
MPELTSQDRLQPSLLDRLTDLEPHNGVESAEQRVLSQKALRRAVVRDLEWLLNTSRYDAVGSLDGFTEVARSVLNYGVPDISGSLASSVVLRTLEREISNAITIYEPRIDGRSLVVTGVLADDRQPGSAVLFEISAEIWGQPGPLHLMLRTEIDLETGQVSVVDFNG